MFFISALGPRGPNAGLQPHTLAAGWMFPVASWIYSDLCHVFFLLSSSSSSPIKTHASFSRLSVSRLSVSPLPKRHRSTIKKELVFSHAASLFNHLQALLPDCSQPGLCSVIRRWLSCLRYIRFQHGYGYSAQGLKLLPLAGMDIFEGFGCLLSVRRRQKCQFR